MHLLLCFSATAKEPTRLSAVCPRCRHAMLAVAAACPIPGASPPPRPACHCAGDRSSARSLAARAKLLLDPPGSAGAGPLQLPSEPVQLAYILAVASAEVARVELLPLAEVSEAGCPLGVGMAYLEVCDPGSPEMEWYQAVVTRVYGSYVARLQKVRRGSVTLRVLSDPASAP